MAVWVNSFPWRVLGALRPQCAEECCRLTANGWYKKLVFVGNVFSWGIQIWNRDIDIISFLWIITYADSDCKVLTFINDTENTMDSKNPSQSLISSIRYLHTSCTCMLLKQITLMYIQIMFGFVIVFVLSFFQCIHFLFSC